MKFRDMNYQFSGILCMLLVASCEQQPKSQRTQDDFKFVRTKGEDRRHEAIAKEVISINVEMGNAMLRFDGSTNVATFASVVESLANRFDKISKELDALGPFPAGLRDSTMRALDDNEKTLALHIPRRTLPPPLQPEAVRIMEHAMVRYSSASLAVSIKAGLNYKGKANAPKGVSQY